MIEDQKPIESVLRALKRLPYAKDIRVFGSVAKRRQGFHFDVDVVLDLRGKKHQGHPAYDDFLQLKEKYLRVDPLILIDGGSTIWFGMSWKGYGKIQQWVASTDATWTRELLPRVGRGEANYFATYSVPLSEVRTRIPDAENIAERERQELRKARYAASEQWVRWVLWHPRYEQIAAFAEVFTHLSDATYWRLLRRVSRRTNYWNHWPLLAALMLHSRSGNDLYMNRREQAMHLLLPDQITIYRGWGEDANGMTNRDGLHFSTSQRVAQNVANFYHGKGHVDTVTVPKADCFLIDNLEQEVIYVPGMGAVQQKVKMLAIDIMLAEEVERAKSYMPLPPDEA